MKKFVTLFTDSARELKSVRTITTMAMLAAVAVILGYFSIEYGQLRQPVQTGNQRYHLEYRKNRLPELFSTERLT